MQAEQEQDREIEAPRLWTRTRIGLVLGPSYGVACEAWGALDPRPGRRLERALPTSDLHTWEEAVASLLVEVRERAGGGRVSIDLSLLRPLALTRTLRLPPVGASALRALVLRASERWFPFAAGEAVEATPFRGVISDEETEPTTQISAADAARLESLLVRARHAGVEVASVCAAAPAAVEGARRLRPELSAGRQRLVLLYRHATEVLLLEGGDLRGIRSLPFVAGEDAGADALRRAEQFRELTAAGDEGEAPTTVVGESETELRAILAEGGEGDDLGRVEGVASAEALAAFGTALPGTRRHDLRPDAHRRPLRQAALRRTAILLTAAALVAIFGASAHLNRVEASAERLAELRATMRPGVQAVLRTRSEIDSLRVRLAALEEVEQARPRWVPFFAQLAESLPREAYVQALRAEEDEVAIDGYARSASTLVLGMERQQAWSDVRFTAPLQREQTAQGERERFSLRFGAPEHLPTRQDTAAIPLPSGPRRGRTP